MFTCLIEWQSLGALEKQLQKKRLLSTSFPSARLSAWNGVTHTGEVFVNVWEFNKMLPARACFGWYRTRITGHFTWKLTYIYWLVFIMETDYSVCEMRAEVQAVVDINIKIEHELLQLCCWGTKNFCRDNNKANALHLLRPVGVYWIVLISLSNRTN